MRRWYRPHNYKGLAVQMVIAGVVYGLGALWVFLTKRAFKVGELGPPDKSIEISGDMNSRPAIEAYQEEV